VAARRARRRAGAWRARPAPSIAPGSLSFPLQSASNAGNDASKQAQDLGNQAQKKGGEAADAAKDAAANAQETAKSLVEQATQLVRVSPAELDVHIC
jgi:hypothetical protein